MTDIKDFIPVISENANSIRARIEADVNAGLDPDDPSFLDTTPGGFWYDLSQAFVLEMERIYDEMGTDFPASMLPQYAWGTTLDEHGLVVGVDRNDASPAVGTVTFTGTVGTLIGTGVQVALEQTDPTADPVAFETVEGGTIPGGGTIDLDVQATQAGAAGNVAAGQITVLLSSVAAPDGTPGIASVTNAASMSGGADIETDDKYRLRILLEWSSARGGGTVADYESYALDYPGVGHVRVVPVVQGPGTVAVIITDENNDPLGTTVVQGLQNELDPPYASTTLGVNATLPTGTITVASTAGFDAAGRFRIGQQIVTYTGKTGTTFTGCTGGVGAFIVPEPVYGIGRGNGLAPIGAAVLVWSPTQTTIAVNLTGVYESGYSAAGTGGTIPLGTAIQESIGNYLNSLAPGEDVIYNKVIAQALLVPGLADVSALTLNAGGGPVSTNIALDDVHVGAAGVITVV